MHKAMLKLVLLAIVASAQSPIPCDGLTDVMICPNGAIVDRDPNNNCNFKPCPLVPPTLTPSTLTPPTNLDAYSLTAKVTGTFSSISGSIRQNGNLVGDFLPLNFSILEDQLAVTGTLSAVLSRTTRRLRQINRTVETPLTLLMDLTDATDILGSSGATDILGNPGRRRLLQLIPTLPQVIPTGTPATGSTTPTQAPGTCNVLHLALQGVTDLDLLGLLVHLEPTFLDITANPVGGLLGSLLCAVGGLLNGLGPLGGLLSGASGLTQGANLLNSVLGLLNLANSAQGLAGLAPVTGLLNSIVGILNLGS